MSSESGSVLARLLPVAGTAYLVWLATQPPPARWVGLGCLAILVPFVGGWLLGNVAGIGPWAPDKAE
ncbi:hypothetical protein [Halobacterium wangiae]|uniref:hypothetical protein n=1 Tax=Halobacterium wangiae TaxID=2902623 RepID=UPI001E59AA7D|nr:hypothetical protein [Halobacterium wangiae]